MPLDGTTGQIAMDCVGCSSGAVTERPDLTAQGYRRFRCRDCDQQFNERSDGVLNRASLPSDIIAFVVFCRLRYRLTLRDLSEIMLLRGFTVSHESIRRWEAKLLPVMGEALRKRRHGIGRSSGQSWLSLLKTSSAACAPAWRWCARLRAANLIQRQDGRKFSPHMQRTVLDQGMDLAIDAARTQWMPASRPPSGSLCRPSISHPFGRPHVIRRSRARSNLAPFSDRLSFVNCLTQAVGEKLGSKKAPPPRRPWSNTSSEIARYCRLGDVETKHQQFTVDAWCAPEHIVSRHTADQVPNLGIDSRPTTSPAAPKPW